MLIKRPHECNLVYNENHENGFQPLPVRIEEVTSPCGQYRVIAHVSAWEPTPVEMAKLRAGGVIEVSLLVPQMVGIMLSVTDPEEPLETPKLTELVENALVRLESVRRHLDRELESHKNDDPELIDKIMDSRDKVSSVIRTMRVFT